MLISPAYAQAGGAPAGFDFISLVFALLYLRANRRALAR